MNNYRLLVSYESILYLKGAGYTIGFVSLIVL